MKLKASFAGLFLLTCSSVFAETPLTIDWKWKLDHKCSNTSPAIEVSGIPSGTKMLEVDLVDQDMTSFDHGGGVAPHSGSAKATIPAGALKMYKGPCPPNFDSFGHEYTFTVKAMAADGKAELARGSKTMTFSASSVKQ